jgi:hypothetical protein
MIFCDELASEFCYDEFLPFGQKQKKKKKRGKILNFFVF